jgi:hypothetical protein
MISQTLIDNDGIELSAHITLKDEKVLTLEGKESHEFMVYTFDDDNDIDFLIERLQELKNNTNG